MVQKGRRHAPIDVWTISQAALRPVSVVCRAGGDRAPSRAGLLHARGRSPPWATGVDDLPGVETQCCHPERRPGVSRDDGAMACRASCSSPEASEACAQHMSKNDWLASLLLRAV